MGPLGTLLSLPVSGPLTGLTWLARQIANAAVQQVLDPGRIETALRLLERRLENGEIDEAAFEAEEERLLEELAEIGRLRAEAEAEDEEDESPPSAAATVMERPSPSPVMAAPTAVIAAPTAVMAAPTAVMAGLGPATPDFALPPADRRKWSAFADHDNGGATDPAAARQEAPAWTPT